MVTGSFFATTPVDRNEIFNAAFPQARQLIGGGGYLSGDDRSLFQKWIDDTVVPAMMRAPENLKAELNACLQPRAVAGITLGSATLDFFNGLLPYYPEGMAQVVASLIVVAAYELRDRNII